MAELFFIKSSFTLERISFLIITNVFGFVKFRTFGFPGVHTKND